MSIDCPRYARGEAHGPHHYVVGSSTGGAGILWRCAGLPVELADGDGDGDGDGARVRLTDRVRLTIRQWGQPEVRDAFLRAARDRMAAELEASGLVSDGSVVEQTRFIRFDPDRGEVTCAAGEADEVLFTRILRCSAR